MGTVMALDQQIQMATKIKHSYVSDFTSKILEVPNICIILIFSAYIHYLI